MKLPITGGTEFSKFQDITSARTVNWFPSRASSGKNEVVLLPTAGFSAATSVTVGSGTGCRGHIPNNLVSLFGNTCFVSATTVTGTTSGTSGMMSGCSGGTLSSSSEYDMFVADSSVYVISGAVAGAYHLWKLDGATADSGTTTSTTANKLVQSGQDFLTTVYPGMVVHNTTDDTYATITAVDSNTTLSLSSDIMVSGEVFEIRKGYNVPWTTPTCCAFMDGYFIVGEGAAGTKGRFYISNLYDPNLWDTVDFATAEKLPDTITAMAVNTGILYLFGTDSLEMWYNSGASSFPFTPVQQGYSTYGCNSPRKLAVHKDILFCFAEDNAGSSTLLTISGTEIKEINNLNLLQCLGEKYYDGGFILVWSYGEHLFVGFHTGTTSVGNSSLSMPVYDFGTDMVHEISYYNNNQAEPMITGIVALGSDPPAYRAYSRNANSYSTMSYLYGLDGSNIITRKRVLPVTHSDDTALSHDKVVIDINNNEGLYVTTGYSSTNIITSYVDLTTLGIVEDSDSIYSPYDGSLNVIDTVSSSTILITATNMSLKYIGTPIDIITSSGNKRIPIGIGLRFRDYGSAWSGTKTRTINKHSDRAVWRKLGRSRNRVYEIVVQSISPVAILAGYISAGAETDD